MQVFEDSQPPAVREVVQTNEICDGGGFDSAAQLGIESYGECGGRVWPLSAAPRSSCHPAMRLACPTKPPSLLLCANCCLPDQLCDDPSFHPTEKNARLAMPMQWSVTDHWMHWIAPKDHLQLWQFFGMLMMVFTNLMGTLAFVVFIY